jgi:cytochrome b-561
MVVDLGKKGWLNERLDLVQFRKKFLRKAFPVHLSFFLGEIALFSLVLLVITGIYLSFSYEPSSNPVVVDGQSVPAAYHSVTQINQQPFGLIVRQVHHWSAHLMIAATLLHLLRVFFTGAFRKPREINWIIGLILLLATIGASFSGYLLPFDEFAVTATGIGYGIARSVPWIGPAVADFIFAGQFPSSGTVPRFYGYHIMLMPLILIGLIAVHMVVMLKQKHSESRFNKGKVEPGKLLGIPMWPHQAAFMAQLFLLMTAGILVIATLFPVHPVELYGPPGPETPTVKPDWYFLWVYGALKLVPGWIDFHFLGAAINAEAIGSVIFPAIVILVTLLWPFLERSKDTVNYMQRSREAAGRTAIGVGTLVFLVVLSVASYEDTLSIALDVFRWAALILPLIVGGVTYGVLLRLKRQKPYLGAASGPKNTSANADLNQ